jgi:hypothetical protein
VEAALARLIATSGVSAAVECLYTCEPSALRDSMLDRLINESTFREQLALERPTVSVLQRAVERLGPQVVESLIRELERRDDGDAGWIVDLLAHVGRPALPQIGASMPTLSPRAIRHMITVFDRLDAWPPNVKSLDYARHSDPTVRRETIRHLVKRDATRDRAILAGLRDRDIRIFNLALGAVTGTCSIEAARTLMSRLEDPQMTDELRARGVRALGDTRHTEARGWIEKRATTRHWFFRSVQLRKPSLELYAILSVLSARKDNRPESKRILELASRSKSEEVRRAASPRTAEAKS